MKVLAWLATVGGIVLGGVGFAGSYSAQHRLAVLHGFGWFAPVFPIGIDAGIVVLLALDLLLAYKQAGWPLLRSLAHLFTLATIVFNAAAGQQSPTADPVGTGMHAIIPVLFISGVEAARRMVIRRVRLQNGLHGVGVPLTSWVLDPGRTWKTWRRRKIWQIPTYAQAIALEQERTVYQVMLEREYGKNWKRKAPAPALLPITMAPYGLSVEEALALPEEQKRREQQRREAEAERQAEETRRQRERDADSTIHDMETTGRVDAAQYRLTAQTSAARTSSEATARAAAEEASATTRLEAADKARRAAEQEARAAELRKHTAEQNENTERSERRAAEEKRRTAAARDEAATRNEAAAEREERATERRLRAAELEARAVELEDAARLSPRERNRRKVARMILAAGGNPEAVELQDIMTELSASKTTASELRNEAAELITQGYRPE